jgi:hypothetical protein
MIEKNWVVGEYNPTQAFLERIQKQPQRAIVDNKEPFKASGMLIAICGDADDKESLEDAHIMSAAHDLYDALAEVDRLLFDQLGNDWQHGEHSDLAIKVALALKKAKPTT